MYPNLDVREILEALVLQIGGVLGGNLVGIYLKGSLALGDFNPETSDVDLLVIVRQALDSADFDRLDKMHRQIQTLPNRYANEVELAYVPASVLNNFVPGLKYPALERGEQLKWKTLGTNWLLEFWTVREHGAALHGPDPKTLIEPIGKEQIVAAVRGVLPDWLEWVDTWGDPSWKTHMGEIRFTVETMCRVMYTLATGQMCSKPQAVLWALAHLPERWLPLIQQSQSWQGGVPVLDTVVEPTQQFVRWAVEEKQHEFG